MFSAFSRLRATDASKDVSDFQVQTNKDNEPLCPTTAATTDVQEKRQPTSNEDKDVKNQRNNLPQITFSDQASSPLDVQSLDVHIQVNLPIAKITSVFTFVNPHNRTLEGELVFPLPDDATLIAYAMNVDGSTELIDAVPVEKEKAKMIFEQEVRDRGKGVAIVEMATHQSNSFRTRVYPLVPQKPKVIRVVYTMPVSTSAVADVPCSEVIIPYGLPGNNSTVKANIEWYGESDKESLELLLNSDRKITDNQPRQASGKYMTATIENSQLDESVDSLTVRCSQTLEDNCVITEDNYFCARIKVEKPMSDSRMKTDKVQVLWDCSYSRSRNTKMIEKDLELLSAIMKELKPKQVVFTPFCNSVQERNRATFGDAQSLLNHVKKVDYDGATNLSLLESELDESASFCIVFTDGIHTIGQETTPYTTYSIPLYIVSTSMSANHQLLSHVATKSGGMLLNANKLRVEQIVEQVGKPVLYFLVADYETEEFEEVYPNEPTILEPSGHFHLYGKVKQGGQMSIAFRYGGDIIDTRVYDIEPSATTASTAQERSDRIIPMLWAKQKMNSLSVFPHLFEKELKHLGREWSIVTPTTSLIVLETLDQYIKHQITPPASLKSVRESYQKLVRQKEDDEKKREANKIQSVLTKWEERKRWHRTVFQVPEKQVNDKCDQRTTASAPPPSPSLSMHRSSSARCEAAPAPLASFSSQSSSSGLKRKKCKNSSARGGSSPALARSLEMNNSAELKKEKQEEEESSNAVTASINIQEWKSDAAYMATISKSSNPYQAYLQERKNLGSSPAFFLDVADFWLTKLKNLNDGVAILTNILELELENAQLFRIVGYRLDQAKQYELAEMVFEKVKKMNPDEPQSYRDLALVKEKLGKLEEAVELFNKVITGKWDLRFDEIEQTAAIELNHCLLKNPDLKPCHDGFRYKMDLDLRISMAWDVNDIDIDLHVHEDCAGGEHCYYAYPRTKIGGYVSRDFRQGYGPEEYMLRKAPHGQFKVTTNYFANHQQSLTGGTTVLCTFFTNYMRPEEKSEIVTIRLQTNQSTIPVCTIDI